MSTKLENEMSLLEDKALGCLAGLALGDALGMPTEFLTHEQIREIYGDVRGLVRPPAWHPHSRLKPGSITDDTGQALAVARAYTEAGYLEAPAVARGLLAWAGGLDPADLEVLIGPSTRQALELLKQGADPRLSGQHGVTNGAAMRAAVVGLVNGGDFQAALVDSIQACLPTHGVTAAISGAAAVAFAVSEAMLPGATLETILKAGKRGAREGRSYGKWKWSTKLESRIALAEKLVREARDEASALRSLYEYVGVDMLVSESVATAFGLLCLAEGDPMRAVCLGAQIGGDTDTIAAIAGSICGAWKGIQAIDHELLETIQAVNNLDLAAEARRLARICKRKQSGKAGG
jgi:ADP-ribosylglycohydrolase